MSRMRERHDTKLYYSISEASAIAKVKPHVLRYWETQFKMLRPKKNKAGNRMYRKRDLKLIQLIKELLYDKGFTIAGARRKLLDERAAFKEQLEISFSEVDRSTMLLEIIRDLKVVVRDLKAGRDAGVALAEADGNGSGGKAPAIDADEDAIDAGFNDDPGAYDDDAVTDSDDETEDEPEASRAGAAKNGSGAGGGTVR